MRRQTTTAALTGLVALLTLVTLELVRFSGPLLDSAYGRGGAATAALAAVLTYAAPGPLAALLGSATRRAGRSRATTLLVGAVLLGLLRMVVQGLHGQARVAVGLVTVAVSVAVLVLAVTLLAGRTGDGRTAAGAVLTGAGGSVGLQLALSTWDAPWQRSALGWSVTAGVAVLTVLLALRVVRQETAGTEQPVRGLWALGPALALAAMMLANAAFAAAQSGLPLVVAGPALGLGLLAAVGLTSYWPDRLLLRRRSAVLGAAVLGASIAAALEVTGTTAPRSALVLIALVAAQLTTALLGARAWAAPTTDVGTTAIRAPGPGLAATTGTGALVGLTTIGPILLFQLDYDVPLGFPNTLVLVGTAAAVAVAGLRNAGPRRADAPTRRAPGPDSRPLLSAGALLLAGTVVALAAWWPGRASDDVTYTGRVVCWNLHYGVSPDAAVDLEAVARVVEVHDPDVVLLQEVSRGWVQGGGADAATWLAQRLDRHFVFAPAADGRFGNVILARGPLTQVRVQPLPYGVGPQRRSALTAVTRLGPRPTTVTSLHLQHRAAGTATRLAQLETFLPTATEPVGLVGGDLNAPPGSPEIARFTAAGYVSALDSVGDAAALTAPTIRPTRRIDWVFGRGVRFAEAEVLTGAALSDHLPLVVALAP